MILAAISLLAASASVPASTAPVTEAMLEPAFSATVLSTYPDGRTSKLWLNRDGTFTGEERDHAKKGGKWNLQGQSICLRQTKPVPIPFLHFCSPIPATGVSVAWNGKAITGEPIVIRLIPGR
ncbi:MAG: hypothetical protein ACYDD1_07660 [Caulobacteraceae bacterium]